MDARASTFTLFLCLCLLPWAGCGEMSLTSETPSAENAESDDDSALNTAFQAPPTGSVTGRLIVPQAASKQDDLQHAMVSSALPTTDPANVIAGELLVTFAESVTSENRDRLLAEAGMREIERSPSGLYRVACPLRPTMDLRLAKSATVEDATALLSRPGVLRAGPNRRRYIAQTPDDKHFPVQWHYQLINLPEAWDLTTGSDEIVVAVVDTGIVSAHPDLQGRLIAGYDFISDPESARDGDGRDPDPEDAGDEYNGSGRSSFHGTHVAGTIGAVTNNGLGGAGITWQGKIMPVRALGVNGGTTFDLAEAIRYAAGLPNVSGTVPAQAARIINLSVASDPGDAPSPEETAAIRDAANAGVLVVIASGNGGSSRAAWPAATPEAISVGAVDLRSDRTVYSNYGPTLDLVAPGGINNADLNRDGFMDGVLSSAVSEANGELLFQYLFSSGTSMASPHVAGVAVLVMAANPSLNAAQVRSILEGTARDLGLPGRDGEYGYGLLDAAAAVREALRIMGLPASGQPAPTIPTDGGIAAQQLYVLALKGDTLAPAAQDETSADEDYAFNLRGLAEGDYVLYAGTDRDGDGFICDSGDLCGALPGLDSPALVRVESGQRLLDVDFQLIERAVGVDDRPLHLPRMR